MTNRHHGCKQTTCPDACHETIQAQNAPLLLTMYGQV